MILTCPQCATRYQVDGAKFPAAGRNVRCAKCGHTWHQPGPEPELEPESLSAEPAFIPHAAPAPEPGYEPAPVQPRVAAFVPAARMDFAAAETELTTSPRPRSSWLGRIALVLGWLLLAGLVLVTGWAAVKYRESVAFWVPKTASFYSAAGLVVSPRGVEIIDVAYHEKTENGQPVLDVTGRVVNRTDHSLGVGRIHVSLFDAENRWLYSWNFVANVATLNRGQSAPFHASISSPPANTKRLEVRFARAGE